MLSDRLIEEYQELYSKHFGEEISREVAVGMGMELVNMVSSIKKLYEQNNENKTDNINDI